jgi:hypothetical protein
MALHDDRVVFGVPTLLHVLTEMARGCSSTASSGVYLYKLWQVAEYSLCLTAITIVAHFWNLLPGRNIHIA